MGTEHPDYVATFERVTQRPVPTAAGRQAATLV